MVGAKTKKTNKRLWEEECLDLTLYRLLAFFILEQDWVSDRSTWSLSNKLTENRLGMLVLLFITHHHPSITYIRNSNQSMVDYFEVYHINKPENLCWYFPILYGRKIKCKTFKLRNIYAWLSYFSKFFREWIFML